MVTNISDVFSVGSGGRRPADIREKKSAKVPRLNRFSKNPTYRIESLFTKCQLSLLLSRVYVVKAMYQSIKVYTRTFDRELSGLLSLTSPPPPQVEANHQIPWMPTGQKCHRSELTSQAVACSKEMESGDGRIDRISANFLILVSRKTLYPLLNERKRRTGSVHVKR